MSRRLNDENCRPELLAAYVDGELDNATRAEVEAWLASRPEAAADLAAQRRLARLCDEAIPPAPSAADWAAVLSNIEAGLARRPARKARVAVGLGLTGLVAAAAAALVAVSLRGGADEPFPVLSADEVHIESMDDADVGALVVGEPPLREPLELLTSADVKVHGIDPDALGRLASVSTAKDAAAPLFVVMPPAAEAGELP